MNDYSSVIYILFLCVNSDETSVLLECTYNNTQIHFMIFHKARVKKEVLKVFLHDQVFNRLTSSKYLGSLIHEKYIYIYIHVSIFWNSVYTQKLYR